jgi:NADH dehydrogenase [ubiquinone] 1 alpha subcomplex assembly factor 5
MDAKQNPPLFDSDLLALRRRRMASRFAGHGFLFDAVAARLADRVLDIKRDFRSPLYIGDRGGYVARDRGAPVREIDFQGDADLADLGVGQHDLIISNLALHWLTDWPFQLPRLRAALKPDGFFLAALFGGKTLQELRSVLSEAEVEVMGGISPRISPTIDTQDAAQLLHRAGFQTPVVDTETLTVTYADAFALMRDLRGMGESNALHARLRRPTPRGVFLRAADLYQSRFAGPDGRIPASFQVVYLAGWQGAVATPSPSHA